MVGHLQSNTGNTQSQQDERRTEPRHTLRLEADVTLPGDLTIVSHTIDISAGGIGIVVPYMLEFGQRCLVEMDLSAIGGPAWLRLTAEVRHCRQMNAEHFLAGLQFVDPDPAFTELFAGML